MNPNLRTRPSLAAVATLGLALSLAACEAETLAPRGDGGLTASDPASSLSGASHPVPATIDATGRRDVTDELLAFFASVPDYSTIVFPEGAKYRVERTLELQDRHGLTFEGNGALIFATEIVPYGGLPGGELDRRNRSRQQWRLDGGSDYVFRNLRIKGAHQNGGTSDYAWVPALEAQHGINIQGVQGLELDRVTITDVYGDFVYITHAGMMRGTVGEYSKNIHIHHSHFERNGRQGIAITGADGVRFEDNYMGQVRRAHIDLEPNSSTDGARNLVFRRNVFGAGRLYFMASAGGSATVENVTVRNNRFEGGKNMTVQIKPPPLGIRRNFRFINNVSDGSYGSSQALMIFYRTRGIEVRGNRQALNEGREMTAVYAEESCDIEVSGNEFENALHILETVGTCPSLGEDGGGDN